MIEKMKYLETLELDEMYELYEALLAYNQGLDSQSITLEQIDAVQKSVAVYKEDDMMKSFINEDIVEAYYECGVEL